MPYWNLQPGTVLLRLDALHTLGEVLHARLGVDHHRVQAGVAQQPRQPAQIAGIGVEVARRECVAQPPSS